MHRGQYFHRPEGALDDPAAVGRRALWDHSEHGDRLRAGVGNSGVGTQSDALRPVHVG